MSNKRYLEIDSTFRNRSEYPNPSSFIVFISQTGTKSKRDALDPVSLATPQKTFSTTDFGVDNGGLTLTGTVDTTSPGIGASNSPSLFVGSFPTGTAQEESNYYVGTSIDIGGEITRIDGWEFISTDGVDDFFRITVNPPLDDTPGAVALEISNSTVLTSSPPTLFIPNGSKADNFYTSCIIYNDTVNEFRTITDYDAATSTAILDLDVTWGDSDVLSLRKEPPTEVGEVSAGSTLTNVVLSNSSSKIDKYNSVVFINVNE